MPRGTSNAASGGGLRTRSRTSSASATIKLVRGLLHLVAAGYRSEDGDRERAARQLEHARRRLAPYLPEHEEVDLAALIELVREKVES